MQFDLKSCNRIVPTLLALVLGGIATAQSQFDQLRMQYQLVSVGLFGPTKPNGTPLVVQQQGIFGVGVHGTANPTATYADGVIHPPLKTAALVGASPATHWFQVGEQVYPMKFEVDEKSDRINMTIVSSNFAFKAVVRFQFHRGFLATAEPSQVQKVLNEVLPIGSADNAGPQNAPASTTAASRARPAGVQPPAAPAVATGGQASAAPAGAPYQVFSSSHMGAVYYMATTEYIVLFPDGSALGGLPPQGLDGFNPQAYLQQMGRNPNTFSRYQFFPDHLELVYSNFSKSYALPGAGVIGSLVPLCVCNGTTFGGVYGSGNFMVQFSPDGSFVDRGLLDNIVWKNFGAPRMSQGRYSLQFNTLYLQAADGRQGRISFAAPAAQEESGSFDWIALDQKMTRRVQ